MAAPSSSAAHPPLPSLADERSNGGSSAAAVARASSRISAAHLAYRVGEMRDEVRAASHFLLNFDPHRHLAVSLPASAPLVSCALSPCRVLVSQACADCCKPLHRRLPPPSATAATPAADAASLAADAHRVASAIPSLYRHGVRPAASVLGSNRDVCTSTPRRSARRGAVSEGESSLAWCSRRPRVAECMRFAGHARAAHEPYVLQYDALSRPRARGRARARRDRRISISSTAVCIIERR